MLKHKYIGCPYNSSCNLKTGTKRQKWIDLLRIKGSLKSYYSKINHFIRKNGIPFGVWNLPSDPTTKEIISWNSPCDYHRKKDSNIKLSQIFVKNVSTKSLKEIQASFNNKILFNQAANGLAFQNKVWVVLPKSVSLLSQLLIVGA